MASIEELREERIRKLTLLNERGVNPYPTESHINKTIHEVLENFDELALSDVVTVGGRILALREHGGSVFVDIFDGTGKLQVYMKKDELGDDSFDLFMDAIDIGDFIETEGKLFLTKKEQKSLQAKSWNILTKSLRPLPDKWHGLTDTEERFRKRYLDILMNEDVRGRFILRSKLVTEIRNILDENDFLEVETPALQPIPGGASAAPFTTHHNALDIDLYLRVSDELYLKRLLVAGFPKVYEIARDFRNEGIDVTHNPEFTMLEYYEAYSDAEKQRAFVEEIFKHIAKNVVGGNTITYQGEEIDITKKFDVISFSDLLKKYAGINSIENISKEDVAKKAEELNVSVDEDEGVEKILDNIYKKTCRPNLIQPTFIVDYPAHYLPLAKRKVNESYFVDAFQVVIGGIEIVKAFSELNDPIDQKDRFIVQEEYKKTGDAEAQSFDEEFLEAIEHGMPPAGGVGIGIDRLVMLLTDTKNIKEVIIFPTMRPKE